MSNRPAIPEQSSVVVSGSFDEIEIPGAEHGSVAIDYRDTPGESPSVIVTVEAGTEFVLASVDGPRTTYRIPLPQERENDH